MIVFLHVNSINLIEVQLRALPLSALQPSISLMTKKTTSDFSGNLSYVDV